MGRAKPLEHAIQFVLRPHDPAPEIAVEQRAEIVPVARGQGFHAVVNDASELFPDVVAGQASVSVWGEVRHGWGHDDGDRRELTR